MTSQATVKSDMGKGFLPVDILLFCYLAITGVLLVCSPEAIANRSAVTTLHLTGLVFVGCLQLMPKAGTTFIRLVRLWYPFVLLPLLYWELSSLNRLITTSFFDSHVVSAEQALFGWQPSQELSIIAPWPFLSELLHFCYGAYEILLPVIGLTFFISRRDAEFRRFATAVMFTFLACYLIFIIIPVRGPFHHFGPPATDSGGFVAGLIHRLLGVASSEGTAFPSSHVAASIAIWFGIRGVFRRLSWAVMIIVIGIILGTVYGGFHYAIDSLAGLIVGVTLGPLGLRLHDRLISLSIGFRKASGVADSCRS